LAKSKIRLLLAKHNKIPSLYDWVWEAA